MSDQLERNSEYRRRWNAMLIDRGTKMATASGIYRKHRMCLEELELFMEQVPKSDWCFLLPVW